MLGRICFVLMTCVVLLPVSDCAGGDSGVDAVSGATKSVETEPGRLPATLQSLSGRSLADFVNGGNAVCLLATTNDNGSPFAERIEARFDSEQVLRFAANPGPTRENIDRNGLAFLSVFGVSYDDKGEKVLVGARLLLERRGDGGETKRKTKGMRSMLMTAVHVLPL